MKIGASTVTAIYLGTTSIVSAYLGATQVFGGASVFTPLDLFSTGAQGIWLDPSDLSTMFSDRAGTTPVTTPGTVVGLRLDKSKGLVLGSELVVNGTFDTNLDGWTASVGATLSRVDNRLQIFGNGAAFEAQAYTTLTLVPGNSYRIEATTFTGDGKIMRVGSSIGGDQAFASGGMPLGRTSYVFRATAITQYLTVLTTSGKTQQFDNISVRELAGNHATAPTDAARPIYGVEPKGGRRNLQLWTEDFSNAVWGKSGSPTLTNQGGGVWRLQAPAGTWSLLQGIYSLVINTFSIEVKSNGAGLDGFQLMMQGSFVGGNRTATSDWVRYSASGPNGGSGAAGIVRTTTNDAVDILIRFPQFELGSTATAYQRTTTAYDVTESGVATCHYVQYDGSDDSMSTAAIDFTATDKMSVFAGVRKFNNATGAIAELSVNFSGGAAFGVFCEGGPGAANNYFLGSTGTIAATIAAAPFVAPITNLVTGLSDISGDRATLRVNGAQIAQSTADQGTGNYGNYAMFIGRRNNATLPFNGRDYGILVVGKAVTPTEITDTETWLAARTSGVSL